MDLSIAFFLGWILAWLSLDIVNGKNGYEQLYPHDFSAEGILIKNLLTSYEQRGGKYGRPVTNHTHAVPVWFMLQLIQIVDLDEKNQVLKLNLWTNYKWIDEFLRWDPDDYQGVTEIRIPSSKIWTPDIKLYNYADLRKDEKRDALCIVNYAGNITWIPQGIYMSTCDIDVTTFPFDKQTCSLKFGSWTHDGTKLDFMFDGPERMKADDYFVPNKAWSVVDVPAKRNTFKYACCPEVYIDLTYTIVFRRSATFYTYILILPCVLLTSLTLVLYWIPPESPTKMALGMSIFMAFFVLLLMFERNMPPASENVPILGTYYCLNMILITTSTFLNVFVVNLSFYGSRAPVPKVLKKVMFQFFAKILCMDNLVRPFLEADKKRLIPPAIPGFGLANGGENKWPKNWKGSTDILLQRKDEIEADPQLAEIDLKLTENLTFNFIEPHVVKFLKDHDNIADTRLQERRDALCIVGHDGNITWIPQGIYMSTCDIDVTTFPFDKQNCSLKFGSWAYHGGKLHLEFLEDKERMLLDDYFVPNKAWIVIEAPGKRNVLSYACCPERYHDLTYTLIFRRSATNYVYILILPCVLLTTLTLVLYWIPPESPTKMSLGMSIYMAFFVLLLMFEANMPPASDGVPILGTYYCLNMILITCSTFLNVFVVNLSYYGARSPVPKLLRTVMFRFFARAMCMDNLVRPFLEADKKRLIPPAIPGMGMGLANGDSKFPRCWRSSCEVLSLKKDQIEPNQQLVEIDVKLTEIREFLSVYRDRLDAKDKNEKIAKEWKALGLIFDRFFFWIYLMTILVSLTVVMSFIFMSN